MIVVGSKLRTRHRLEDRWKVDLLAHLIDLLLDDRILSLHDVIDDLGAASPPRSLPLAGHACSQLVHWFTAGSCLETIFASCVFATCCVRFRIFDDLFHHCVCGPDILRICATTRSGVPSRRML